jgi:hypothetical protein
LRFRRHTEIGRGYARRPVPLLPRLGDRDLNWR